MNEHTIEGNWASSTTAAPQLAAASPIADQSRPVWFGREGALFGFYHPGQAGQGYARRVAIVFCAPFGYEAMCAHRPYRRLAESLSRQGFPVLRFDYHGTGNSGGDDHDADRVAAWVASTRNAIEHVQTLSGCTRVVLFGVRLGASIAALAAEGRSDVTGLALWGPPLTGSAFLREELAVHKLRSHRPEQEAPAPGPNDDIEALGFVLTAATARALKAINLDKLTSAPSAALILTRDTPLQEARVAATFERLGARVSVEPITGYAAMIYTSQVPEPVWQRVESYIDELERSLGDDLPASELAQFEPDAHAKSAAVQTTFPGDVVETARWFGPDRRLFGVLTQPRERARSDTPVIVLLSGGVNPQVGTNRMHTRWARNWAALGLTTFRFDLGGIGDSSARDGEPDGQLYTMVGCADVTDALDHLSETLGAKRFMLIGLCSGAFVAFHSALADARVTDIAMLNLLRFYWSADDSIEAVQAERRKQMRSVNYYLGAMTRREHWEKLFRGRVNLKSITKHLAQRTVRRSLHLGAYWLSRVAGTALPVDSDNPLTRDFHVLARRGVASLVVYDGDEPMLDDFREQLGPELPRLQATKLVRLDVINGADHIFSPVASQAVLADRLTEYLRTRILAEAVA